MKAGAARADITPPVGAPIVSAGYAGGGIRGERVADELSARALVIEDDGGSRAAVVSLDLVGTPASFAGPVREAAGKLAGIDPAGIMLVSTHTHFVPHLGGLGLGMDDSDPLLVSWSEAIPGAIAEAVKAAADSLEPVRMLYGQGELAAAHYNRRTRRPDGSVVTSFRWPKDPDEFEFRPVDDAVRVLSLVGESGNTVASAVNYACHAVCGSVDEPEAFSADFPGVTCRTVEAAIGGTCLFLQGACGDVVPRERGRQGRRGVGTSLAGAALSLLPWLAEEAAGPVRFAVRRVELNRAPPPTREAAEAKLAEARAAAGSSPGGESQGAVDAAERALEKIDRAVAEWTPQVTTEVIALRVGPVAIAGIGAEVCTTLGDLFREKAEASFPVFLELTNDYIGYLLDEDDWSRGGYEAGITRVDRGEAEKLIIAAAELVNELAE